ncbi:MAG: hypothetical protein LBO00_09170 [Zoogloeaceae bacterium]|jgi:hypothetical protein|nr:hypothetical protein [Zoogloeaceae bacterium]
MISTHRMLIPHSTYPEPKNIFRKRSLVTALFASVALMGASSLQAQTTKDQEIEELKAENARLRQALSARDGETTPVATPSPPPHPVYRRQLRR